jgi:protein-S-isoprenylcysteine O-methyltransferase Ste14
LKVKPQPSLFSFLAAVIVGGSLRKEQTMISFGNFLFHYRNGLFPIAYLVLFWHRPVIFENCLLSAAIGFTLAIAGQTLRALTTGFADVFQGGRKCRVHAEALVEGGMFAHSRNPLYLGNVMILTGLGFIANSALFVMIFVPFFILAYLAIIAAEESYLEGKFGHAFIAYCGRVNRLIPNFAGMRETFRGQRFRWRRLIVKEYGSACAWPAAGIVLATINVSARNGVESSKPLIVASSILLALLGVLYVSARFLKKTGRVRAD